MSKITELKETINTKTLNLVLLSIATVGIYAIAWLFMNTQKLENITSKTIVGHNFLTCIAVCLGLSSALGNTGDESLVIVAGLLSIASWVLYVIWAFKAKSALQGYALAEHQVDLKMNGFYTFIFTIYYINYCINDLPEVQSKQKALIEPVENKES